MNTDKCSIPEPLRIPPPCGRNDAAYFERFYDALAAGKDVVIEGWDIRRFAALGGVFEWGTFSLGLAQVPPETVSRCTITACILCRDCRSRLGPCVSAARTLADSVVIVDSGSSDGTWEEALQIADKAVRLLDRIDYGRLRTAALEQVQSDWAFMLDTDETIPVGAAEILRRAITWSDNNKVDVIWQTRNWIAPSAFSPLRAYRGHPFLWPDPQARLVRMAAKPRYVGRLHERLDATAGRNACLVGGAGCSLLHFKYWLTNEAERTQLIHDRQRVMPDGPDLVQLTPHEHGGYIVDLNDRISLPLEAQEFLRGLRGTNATAVHIFG